MFDPKRRRFVQSLGTVAGAAVLSPSAARLDAASPASTRAAAAKGDRARAAYDLRVRAARRVLDERVPTHRVNGDEARYPAHIASFSKGLPHNALGEPHPDAFAAFVRALETRDGEQLERISMAGTRRLMNPLAGVAFEATGADPQSITIPAPPAFSSAQEAAEIAENYWMALLRDVPFSDYHFCPKVARAVADLSRFSDFRGPKSGKAVTPQTLFRSRITGSIGGPYVSQFFYLEARFGSERMTRQMRTVVPDVDYLTSYDDWLAVQNGTTPWPDQYDATPRFIRSARDLGQWVHYDLLFQAYLQALLVLYRIGARLDSSNPYLISQNQAGMMTFGNNHIASVMCDVARPAGKAAWFHKWFVHRSLRPEVFAGRIHNHATGRAQYPIHHDIFDSDVLTAVFSKYGTYLLPQAYPEGSPVHPSYAAGHATIAGACVTILKAFFDESFVIRNPVQPNPDGTALEPYEGPPLTVGGELDKLACNVAFGRNMAGVHWRSDAEASLRLGEEIAIRYLRDDRDWLPERFDGYTLTRFDGTRITI